MRLGEIEDVDGSMLAALAEAYRNRWGRTEDLLRTVALEVNDLKNLYLRRNYEVRDVEPLVIRRPWDPEPKKRSLRETAREALAYLRG